MSHKHTQETCQAGMRRGENEVRHEHRERYGLYQPPGRLAGKEAKIINNPIMLYHTVHVTKANSRTWLNQSGRELTINATNENAKLGTALDVRRQLCVTHRVSPVFNNCFKGHFLITEIFNNCHQMVPVCCRSRSHRLKIDFQNVFFKDLLV